MSLKRVNKLKERLDGNRELLKHYDDIFQEQLQAGIIEEVHDEGECGNVTYLPHREVVKDQSVTTKVRIVFDASARLKGQPCLNDILYKGPCLNPELYNLLLQFRVYPIAIKGDIEKAYLQISVDEKDRDLLRFLWFKNLFNEHQVELCKYRFTRVIFGANCSQFLLNATIENHVSKYAVLDAEFVKKVPNTSVNSVKEGVELVKNIKVRFSEAQSNVRKFRSNGQELRTYFKTLENVNIVNNTVYKEVVDCKINNKQKILGILWDEIEDNLVFRLDDIFKDAANVVPTKRNILSVISTFYDPVGYLQPFTIQLKILFQKIYKLNINWDNSIGELLVEWKKIL